MLLHSTKMFNTDYKVYCETKRKNGIQDALEEDCDESFWIISGKRA